MRLDASDKVREAYRRVLLDLRNVVEAKVPGAIDGTDPEELHDLRVAVRRSRAVLAKAKGVIPEDVRAQHRAGFGWLGTVTGPTRDLDVYVLGWDDYTGPLSDHAKAHLAALRTELQHRRAEARATMREELRSTRAVELLAGWEAWLRDPMAPVAGEPSVGAVVAKHIAKAHRRVIKHGRAIDDDAPSEALHDLRKDGKALRYLVECFGSMFPDKARKAFVKQMKVLQDNLGEHQDASVQADDLRQTAIELEASGQADPETLLAIGQLVELMDQRRVAARGDFADRFAAYDAPSTTTLLDALLAPARSVGD